MTHGGLLSIVLGFLGSTDPGRASHKGDTPNRMFCPDLSLGPTKKEALGTVPPLCLDPSTQGVEADKGSASWTLARLLLVALPLHV